MKGKLIIIIGISLVITHSIADTLKIEMYLTAKKHSYIGAIKAHDTKYGLLLVPKLKGLPPGLHGFHLHEYPSCMNQGKAAGGHLDPKKTGKHLGPYNDQGHLGDLPVLIVNKKGVADLPVLAPRLKVKNLKDHALIIHAKSDNYSDFPETLGGGGARIACGVIE